MLTDFYNIWHRVYWYNKQHKSYWFAHFTYLMLLHYLGKINYWFWAFWTLFSLVVCVWFWKEPFFWCWDEDTDLEMVPYCRCSKSPPLAATQAVKALSSTWRVPQLTCSTSRRTGCKRTVIGLLRRITELMTPNSLDLNPLGYHVWGAMLKNYRKLQQVAKSITCVA